MSVELKILSRAVSDFLYKEEATISTAESCTGGEVSVALTSIPGSSRFFHGGIVAYSNALKTEFLHVSPQTLEEHGAVSEETAREMLLGALKTFGTKYAIATTGIAGPTGATPGKPVGTIWVAAGNKDEIVTALLTEDEGRTINVEKATVKALQLLLSFKKEEEKGKENE